MKTLKKLLDKIGGLTIGSATKNFTCGVASFTEIQVDLPSNAIAISAVYLSGTGSALLDLYGFRKSGNKAYIRIAHRGSGSGSVTCQAEVQYLTWGGYCIVSLLCAISSLVRRWSHEKENYRPAEVFDRYVLKYSDKYNVRDSGIVCDVSDNRRFKRRIYACWNYWNESKSWRLVSSSSVFERFKRNIELLQSWNSGVHGSIKRHNGNSIVQEGTVALERGCC